MWISACQFFVILTLIFDVYFIKGLKWISEPLEVNKCKGRTVNLTWEYAEEPGEEVTQLQWIFNRTVLIAYSSVNQGFIVEARYQGRVNQSGKTGILLYNISTNDSGNYTLYPVIKWIDKLDKPNMPPVQLNVIEEALEPDCSCKKFLVLPEERNGQAYRIKVGSCNLEINSSVCCPVGLVYQHCVNDPSTICVPIGNHNNVTGSTTQSRIGNQDSAGKELGVNLNQHNTNIYVFLGIICVMLLILVIMGVIFFAVKKWKNPRKTRNVEVEAVELRASQDDL